MLYIYEIHFTYAQVSDLQHLKCLPVSESPIIGYEKNTLIHSILLYERVHSYEIFGTFHKSHVQQKAASSGFPEDHRKKKKVAFFASFQ